MSLLLLLLLLLLVRESRLLCAVSLGRLFGSDNSGAKGSVGDELDDVAREEAKGGKKGAEGA